MNVTVDDRISEHLIKKLKQLGVDKSKVNVIKDSRTTEKKVQALLQRTMQPAVITLK